MARKSLPDEPKLLARAPLVAGHQSVVKDACETRLLLHEREESLTSHRKKLVVPIHQKLLKRTIRFLRHADDRLSRLLDEGVSTPQRSLLSTAESPKDGGVPTPRLALVAGYFSYRSGGATFGDTEAMRVVTHWLAGAGVPYHLAGHEDYGYAGVNLETVDPKAYTHFVFVCGPWKPERYGRLLDRFKHCTRIGVDLSIQHAKHGFDVCLPRDYLNQANPDLAFVSPVPTLPLVGVALVHKQSEYGERQRHKRVRAIVTSYLARGEIAAIPLDTRHIQNPTGVTHAAAYENLVRRLDVVITTRMHGLVFAIKSGTPVVAIDPVAGGAKVSAQGRALGWPVLDGDSLDEQGLADAVAWALEDARKAEIVERQERALKRLDEIHRKFSSLFE